MVAKVQIITISANIEYVSIISIKNWLSVCILQFLSPPLFDRLLLLNHFDTIGLMTTYQTALPRKG